MTREDGPQGLALQADLSGIASLSLVDRPRRCLAPHVSSAGRPHHDRTVKCAGSGERIQSPSSCCMPSGVGRSARAPACAPRGLSDERLRIGDRRPGRTGPGAPQREASGNHPVPPPTKTATHHRASATSRTAYSFTAMPDVTPGMCWPHSDLAMADLFDEKANDHGSLTLGRPSPLRARRTMTPLEKQPMTCCNYPT